MALIMAGGEGRQHELNGLLEEIDHRLRKKRIKLDVPEEFEIKTPKFSVISNPIRRLRAPSLISFQKHMDEQHTPIILTDCLSHWPALQKWISPRYWLSKTLNGTRLVPIELGESYTSTAWSQKLIPFTQFLSLHLLTSTTTPKGYLAQHDLLSQIPSLRNDILIPDYRYADPPLRETPDMPLVEYAGTQGGEVLMNIWLGPEGTRSPLHNDPYENVFSQVVGYKYFRLYPPRETEKVYPRGIEGGIQMGNTSQVGAPPLSLFAPFRSPVFRALCVFCVLFLDGGNGRLMWKTRGGSSLFSKRRRMWRLF
jgi:lysine-specific demethylase 8